MALNEHAADDLRIDPTQVKPDTEDDVFRLPNRIDAYQSDGIKPSDIAKDHYLPHPEKKVISETKQEISATKLETSTKESSFKIEEKHTKLPRSDAVESHSIDAEEKHISKQTINQSAEVVQKSKVSESTETTRVISNLPDQGTPRADTQLALLPKNTAYNNNANNPKDAGDHNQQKSSNTSPSSAGGAESSNQLTTNNNHLPLHPFRTVTTFKFGDKPGPNGEPPTPNLPDFLVPQHLITYETTLEVNIQKIPFPDPPPSPKFIKKFVVHTENLERRTRAFLTSNFNMEPPEKSLRSARQKIRSLKSTFLRSNDEVKHATDTVQKAKSGDFLNIYNPYLGAEKPQYEFIEVPSEEECTDYSSRRSERGQSAQVMEEQYSSRYSSRTSKKRVEGE